MLRFAQLSIIATVWTLLAPSALFAKEYHHDVVIYGGTSAAVVAAVQVKRMGNILINNSQRERWS